MKNFLFIVFSLFTWFEIAVLFIVFMPFQLILFLLTALWDRHRRLMHYHASIYVTIALWLSPSFRLKIEGRENLDRKKAHVVIMNHQSLLDILLAFRLFYPVKMIGKSVLARIPIVGWNIYLAGHIFVDRTSRKSQFEAIRRMEKILLSGDSMLVYPEGTRTRDGEIKEYKRGGFRSAAETGTPILPVLVDGAYKALPKAGFIVDGVHTLRIRIMPPVPVEKGADTAVLAKNCREIMSAELSRLREESN